MQKPPTKTIKCRLGQIDFINTLPIDYPLHKFLQSKNPDFDFTIINATPSQLNKLLFNEELDVAPISSIEYLRHEDKYLLVPDLSISSYKEAESVKFFSKYSLEALKAKNEKIYLSNHSETSINLFKILLKKKYAFELEKTSFEKFEDEHHKLPNKVLIGDEALLEDPSAWDYVLDLGEEWNELSNGLPMVFGLWTSLKTYELKDELVRLLHTLKAQGLGELLPGTIVAAYAKTGLSKKDLHRYFSKLNYDFREVHQKSLDLFKSLLLELSLL
jgi:chorismate dehydratase